ncbi:hypothetical protein HDU76_011107, partial [Blyttiomyces sp. JEL0837]
MENHNPEFYSNIEPHNFGSFAIALTIAARNEAMNLAVKSLFAEDGLRWEITSQMKYPAFRPTLAEKELDRSLPTYKEVSSSDRSNQNTLREIMKNDFMRAFAPYLKKAENIPVDIVDKINVSESSFETTMDNPKTET